QPPATPATPQSPSIRTTDSFHTLIIRLREALTTQRKVAIWQPERSKTFHAILVDKEVRFPPRKLVPPDDPQYASSHSPLSPLTPSSPLHPDGLIAPIWIRKHTTLVPSVFVMFLRLYEHPPNNPKSPLEGPDMDREREREAEERRHDTDLSAEIANRKKSTNERNIKLTVVLLASRKMLDDPTLDARLTYIRRHSGLDSRAALFVLSPVSQAELGEFVKSLSQALYEPAVEYYTSHSKRVRRKRNRHSTTVSSYPNPSIGNIARPLRPEGWTVRYEYKMACFAEFRGEDEVALKHYQDAYDMLVIMFGSPAILPPRTKRWAEAKVLADTINIKVPTLSVYPRLGELTAEKIIKLYLYNNEHSLALSHHSMHIRKFGDFSRGWGIGEETFEFWSWVARQNRLFAELLEQGTHSTLIIPVHKPQLPSPGTSTSQVLTPTAQHMAGIDIDHRTIGLNPSHSLQHPGYYYYAAARCTEMRRIKFQVALEAEARIQSGNPISLSPGFTNEKKVDHNTIILELYTKAYELFKKYNPGDPSNHGQGRLTLWIAYRIAQTYCDSGQYEMAIRFFERIARTYRREHWGSMLRPLLTTWYSCAKQLGDVELSIRLLFELMGHDIPDESDTSGLEEDLIAVLESTVPESPEGAFVLDFAESNPLFVTSAVFWAPSVQVGEAAAFQLSLTAPSSNSIFSLPFDSLSIYLEDERPAITVRHSVNKDHEAGSIRWVDVGNISSRDHAEIEANLQWKLGDTLVVFGRLVSDVPTTLKIVRLALTLRLNAWTVEIPLQPCAGRQGKPTAGKWLSSLTPPRFTNVKREHSWSTIVKHRPHRISVVVQHRSPAYLDEKYPITIEVTNVDDKDLELTLDVLLQPVDVDGAANIIILDHEQSSSLIKGVSCGVLKPGVAVVKTLHLLSSGAAGDRVLDISVQTKSLDNVSSVDQKEHEERESDITERLRTIVVPTVDAFQFTHDVIYQHNTKEWSALTDLESYEESYLDTGRSAETQITTDMRIVGPWPVYIEHVEYEDTDARTQLLATSLTSEDIDLFPEDFLPEDEFNISSRFSMPLDESANEKTSFAPGQYMIQWRRVHEDGSRGEPSLTRIKLSQLTPPQGIIVALLDVPTIAKLHVPLSLRLSIRNYHPILSANILCQLETDSSDSFVVSGLRSGRLPILLPGEEEQITWRLIPMECGHMRLPKLKVFNRRNAVTPSQAQNTAEGTTGSNDGDSVEIVDVRYDQRFGVESELRTGKEKGQMTILVCP
ncbi:Trafficking protein particle complex subunit 11, partial [Leucoagaricus sp. SymC.cos]